MDVWEKCRAWQEEGTDCVVATVIKGDAGSPGKSGFKMLFSRDGRQFGTVGGGAVELKTTEMAKNVFKSQSNALLQIQLKEVDMTCGGDMEIFLEYITARRQFILFGAGHVGRALTPLLESVGFTLTLFDDREESISFADEQKGRQVIIGDYGDIAVLHDKIKKSGFVFVATHGHAHDETLMGQLFALQNEYMYLGVIGSRKKIATALHTLKDKGLTPPQRFFAPVGLAIGGNSAAEIALAIAAEVVAVSYGKDVIHMKDAKK